MGYVYLHKKSNNNNNEPFYVGLGGFCKSEKPKTYSRAYKMTQRNKHHHSIVKKHGFIFEHSE